MLTFEDLASALPAEPANLLNTEITLDTPLQILFTSGTTAEPKGIVHTHRNVLASLEPIEHEMQRYVRYERLVHPLRFLHTLPLSHVFGQFMGLWIPALLAAEVHFEMRLQPARLLETMRRERISLLAAVPRVLELLKTHLEAERPALAAELKGAQGASIARRWWRFRGVHRAFGLKFWAFVCGGASLPKELEQFWRTLGFVVVQGYGMTETSALITLNHPFRTGQGTLGKPLPGREIRIRDDGEILVRGDMVSSATWQAGILQQRTDPWLATGDLVTQDETGQLRFVGRKSEVIVTPAGLNVHPEDVESALKREPGIEEAVVFAFATAAGTEPAAVLLFRGDTASAQAAVVAANAKLAEYQRIRRWAVWPGLDLPRSSTGKIQRRSVSEWFAGQQAQDRQAGASRDPLRQLIGSISGTEAAELGENARLEEDLRLDSLGRVQLQSALEQQLGITVSDEALLAAETLQDLRRITGLSETSISPFDSADATPRIGSVPSVARPPRKFVYPRWPWSWPMRVLRVIFVEAIMRPLVALLAAPAVRRKPKDGARAAHADRRESRHFV